MTNYCGSCGFQLESDMKFCPKCGSTLESQKPSMGGGQAATYPQNIMEQNIGYIPRPAPTYNPQPAYQPPAYQPRTGYYRPSYGTNLGTTSIVCAIIGLCCSVGFIFGIIAIITGALGARSDDNQGPAIAGLIIGIIDIIIGIAIIGLAFMWLFSYPYYY